MDELCLKEIFEDFNAKFSGKKCIVETNYSKLTNFTVSFDVLDLHHLLGLHKVTSLKATDSIESIKQEKFTIELFKNHPQYSDIKPRIENYQFIEEVFQTASIEVCILDKDIKQKNSMNLAVVFFKKDRNKYIVLGLKRNIRTDTFHLATLHETRSKQYESYKKTKFEITEWI